MSIVTPSYSGDVVKKQRVLPGSSSNNSQHTACIVPNSPISLTRVRGISNVWNEGGFGVNFKELVQGNLKDVVISNYMLDFGWVLSAYPDLKKCEQLLLIHGEKNAMEIKTTSEAQGLTNVRQVSPPLPIQFGTHHSKFFLVTFKDQTGLRLIIHTANMIYQDCNNKTQGVWYQDFPPKNQSSEQLNSNELLQSEFERDLLNYFKKLQLPNYLWIWVEGIIKAHDFRFARGHLVASVPGYHNGDELERYGHVRVAKFLEKETFDGKFAGSPLVCQFSSLGSLDEKWLYSEFMASLSRGKCSPHTSPLGIPIGNKVALVWPTVDEVRNSLEGWKAGYSIPGNVKNVSKPFLQQLWHRFDGSKVGRQRAMPHIKTFARYCGTDLCWCVLGSHNLSKAAWGTYQKKNTQLMIRSYELGVLVTPDTELRYLNSEQYGYICGSDQSSVLTEQRQSDVSSGTRQVNKIKRVDLRVFTGKSVKTKQMSDDGNDHENELEIDKQAKTVDILLPYEVPPVRYSNEDVPWKVDGDYGQDLDIFGEEYGVPAKFYGNVERND